MFSMRFDDTDIMNDFYHPATAHHSQSVSKYGAMNSSAVKRNSKQIKNQLEIKRVKDKANEKLSQHETFISFMEYMKSLNSCTTGEESKEGGE